MQRKKVLLIFDLNGTLLSRNKTSTKSLINVVHKFTCNSCKVIVRPFLDEFFQSIIPDFHVAVWTSCVEKNAAALVKNIGLCCDEFKVENLRFVYARDKCKLYQRNETDLDDKENKPRDGKIKFIKPLAVKNLSVVWDDYGGEFDARNTIIVEDSSEKIPQKENLILVSEFCNEKRFESDRELVRLQEYLARLTRWYREDLDIREFLKAEPFNKIS